MDTIERRCNTLEKRKQDALIHELIVELRARADHPLFCEIFLNVLHIIRYYWYDVQVIQEEARLVVESILFDYHLNNCYTVDVIFECGPHHRREHRIKRNARLHLSNFDIVYPSSYQQPSISINIWKNKNTTSECGYGSSYLKNVQYTLFRIIERVSGEINGLYVHGCGNIFTESKDVNRFYLSKICVGYILIEYFKKISAYHAKNKKRSFELCTCGYLSKNVCVCDKKMNTEIFRVEKEIKKELPNFL